MKERPTFGDAARLYAEHAEVVEAIKAEFNASIDAVLDAARDEVDRRLRVDLDEPGRRLCERVVGRDQVFRPWRSWHWGEEGSDGSKAPRVWFYTWKPEIVVPGQLTVMASVHGACNPADRPRYLAARDEVGLLTRAGEERGIFTFDAPCAGPDPAAELAGPIARTLVALRRVERSLGRA